MWSHSDNNDNLQLQLKCFLEKILLSLPLPLCRSASLLKQPITSMAQSIGDKRMLCYMYDCKCLGRVRVSSQCQSEFAFGSDGSPVGQAIINEFHSKHLSSPNLFSYFFSILIIRVFIFILLNIIRNMYIFMYMLYGICTESEARNIIS